MVLPIRASRGRTMPEFTTVSVQEAKVRAIPGRQGQFINEYAQYIQQLPAGQAGRLRIGQSEKHTTIRRRLISAANALGIHIIIKRSGNDLYFWRENGGAEPRTKHRYTRRGRTDGEIPAPDQPVDELGMVEQGIPEERQTFPAEDSSELGQTDPVVVDAMRRVDPE
jgi:hypothetical protein